MLEKIKEKITVKKEPDYKKLYYRTQFEAIIIIFIFILFLYFNFNYLLFKVIMSQNYIYTDSLDKVFSDCLDTDIKGNYFKEFDNVAIKLFTEKLTDINGDIYTKLYTPSQYTNYEETLQNDAAECEIHQIGETTYLHLTNFSPYSLSFVNENEDKLKNTKNLIIDLSDNGGGELPICCDLADRFLPKDSIIYEEVGRNFFFSSLNKAKTDISYNYDNICIVQNEYTASASEVFINALKENLDNVTVIGTKSYGKGIEQATYDLTNGYAFKLTTVSLKTPHGNSIHKKGIIPDIYYSGENAEEFITQNINATSKGANTYVY